MLKSDRTMARDGLDFGPNPAHEIGPNRQQIENPGQCAGAGFVAREKQYPQLIDEFVARETLAGFVPGRDHCRGNIVKIRTIY